MARAARPNVKEGIELEEERISLTWKGIISRFIDLLEQEMLSTLEKTFFRGLP